MSSSGASNTLKVANAGESITEKILYASLMIILIAGFIVLFDMFIPGREYSIPFTDSTFYITYEFYQNNKFFIYIIPSLIAYFIARSVVYFHQRSVKKRIRSYWG